MTAHDDLGLRRQFVAIADTRIAEGALEAVLARTSVVSPRPAWLVVLRGGATIVPLRPSSERVRLAMLVAALTLALVGLLLLLAGRPPTPPSVTGLLAFSRDGDVYVSAPDGSGAVVVAHDGAVDLRVAAWSPDNTLIAVEAALPPVVFVVDPGAQSIRRVGDGAFVGWLPDSRSMLIDAWPDGSRIVTFGGDVGRRFGRLVLPVLSPDGRWLAGVPSGTQTMVVMDVATGATIELGPAFGMGIGWSSGWDYPAWSPDSRRLAYLSPSGTDVVVTIGAVDGSPPVRLDVTLGQTGRASWSPDGRWIAYVRDPALEIIRPDGTGHRRLVERVGEVRLITRPFAKAGHRWDAASAHITFFTTDGQLAQVEVATGDVRTLGGLGPGIDGFGWQQLPPDQAVPSMPPAASSAPEAPPAVIGEPLSGGPVDPSGWQGLAYDVSRDDGSCDGGVFDFATGATTVVTSLCGLWSPDGSRFAGRDGTSSVRIVDRSGALVGEVTSPHTRAGDIHALEWSPGGGWLFADACLPPDAPPPTDPGPGVSAAPIFPRVPGPSCVSASFIAGRDGTAVRAVPGRPLWSATDTRMAIASANGLLVGSGSASDLAPIGAFPLPTSWSPDAGRFTYIRDGDVWIANADGTGARNLSAFAVAGATDALWSPDGAHVAVVQGRSVWVMTPDGSSRRRLDVGGLVAPRLVWSPDGRHLAIEPEYESSVQSLVLLAIDDWRAVGIPRASPVAWSPDSRFLVIGSDASTDIVRSDGSGRRRMTATGLEHARWMP